MNIYIMVDAEGISGIYDSQQVMATGTRYHEGRELMVADINACVEGCKEAGADKIYVRDCHGSGSNIIWSQLSNLADYYIIGNTGQDRFPGLDECQGGNTSGISRHGRYTWCDLEHTMSSASVQNYWINGMKVGELAIDAGIVGDRGKPVIMVSGDDKVCLEAKRLLPNVVTAEVKRGYNLEGWYAASTREILRPYKGKSQGSRQLFGQARAFGLFKAHKAEGRVNRKRSTSTCHIPSPI